MPFGTEKLEWCGYLMFKNIFIRFGTNNERDGRTNTHTDRHRMTT